MILAVLRRFSLDVLLADVDPVAHTALHDALEKE